MPKYKYNFWQRTFLYGFVGTFCVFLDFFIFIQLIKIIRPIYSNFFGYVFGSICSYFLNKNFTFKSHNSKLSAKRYLLILLIGFISSQIVIYIGLNFYSSFISIKYIKFLAIIVAALVQYLCNSNFGSSKKINKNV